MLSKMKRAKFLVFAIWMGLSATLTVKAQDVAKGEEIFKGNCAACHNTSDEKLIGPGLKDVEKRRSMDWLVKWVQNPAAMIKSDDIAKEVYAKYGPTVMTAYPNYGKAEIESIVAYVQAQNVPKVTVVDGPPSPNGGGSGSSNGGMFEYLMLGILVLMIVVLVALLSIVNSLTKKASADAPNAEKGSFFAELSHKLNLLGQNTAVKGGVITLFILLLGKITTDKAFEVGISQGYAPKQPIEFSHKLHAGQYKINCAYCHTGVYKTKGANIPSANICMNCHNAIKRDSPEIQKIYTALEDDKPIEWVRVHNLPDLAYFNHAQHTNVAGLNCTNCHGEVEKMEIIEQRSSLTMGWCIDCHRETNVNAAGNAYYDKLLEIHKKEGSGPMKVKDIGGLECSKCHY
jgi:mono/diheme cytochrome c family protein